MTPQEAARTIAEILPNEDGAKMLADPFECGILCGLAMANANTAAARMLGVANPAEPVDVLHQYWQAELAAKDASIKDGTKMIQELASENYDLKEGVI